MANEPISINTGPLILLEKANALEQKYGVVCLDDLRGRRMAAAAGLRVVGALSLLARAKQLQIIPAIKPFTDRLMSAEAWYAPELIRRVLRIAGE